MARREVQRRRRARGRQARGIAEIVGTLMLVLIVVAAAVAFAAFVASYQKQLQTEQAQSQQRSLESLRVLGVSFPVLNGSNATVWPSFRFVLASEYIHPSTIASISINGNPLRSYVAQNVTPSCPATCPSIPYNGSSSLTLGPLQEVLLTVNQTASSPSFSYFDNSSVLTVNDYAEISIFTLLQNTFTQIFIPPVALPVVDSMVECTPTCANVLILDGSGSFQPGNGTMVSWSWSVTDNNTSATLPASGEKVVFGWYVPGDRYTIALTVENSYGMFGTATISYPYP